MQIINEIIEDYRLSMKEDEFKIKLTPRENQIVSLVLFYFYNHICELDSVEDELVNTLHSAFEKINNA